MIGYSSTLHEEMISNNLGKSGNLSTSEDTRCSSEDSVEMIWNFYKSMCFPCYLQDNTCICF